MNTQKAAMHKIATIQKEELSAQKVELALVDDYNKRIDKANNERKMAAVSYQKLIGQMQSATIQLDLALKEANKIEEAAKQLGVKSPIDIARVKSTLTQYTKIVNALKSLRISGGDDI